MESTRRFFNKKYVTNIFLNIYLLTFFLILNLIIMINVNFIGRLGRDAEVHSAQNGGQFISMNVATDVFNPQTKQNDTIWLRVTDGSDRTMKMLQYLKKGTMLNIVGELRTSIYNGQNGPSISHDVRCFNWDFVRSGRQDAAEGNSTTATSQPQTTVTTVTTPQVTPNVVREATTSTFVQPTLAATSNVNALTSNPDDDLPF